MHLGKNVEEIEIMENDIKNSIKTLYEVFKPYTILGKLRERSCDCCVTNSDVKFLLSKKIKDLSEDNLGHFLRKSITTFGDENDYKHFLPRILELLYSNENLIDDFLTFEKLNYTNWKSWKKEEIKAIKKYFLSLWINALTKDDNEYLEYVFMLVLQYLDTEEIFIEWEKKLTNVTIKLILDYILNGIDFNISKEKDEVFNKWIRSKTTLSLFEKLYFEEEDEIIGNRLSIAYSILEKSDK